MCVVILQRKKYIKKKKLSPFQTLKMFSMQLKRQITSCNYILCNCMLCGEQAEISLFAIHMNDILEDLALHSA